jgi:hypothetical protein
MTIVEYQVRSLQMIHNRNMAQTFLSKKEVIYQGCPQPRGARIQQENFIDIFYNIIIL